MEATVGSLSAFGALGAAVAAWWAARVAIRIATEDRQSHSHREARTEARQVIGRRIDSLLDLMSVVENAFAIDGAIAIIGSRAHGIASHRPGESEAKVNASVFGELRARLLLTREYLPLTRSLVLDGTSFSAGDFSAPFEALDDQLDADDDWWLGLSPNDHDSAELQVVRAEILATVRGLERTAKAIANSTASDVSFISGWEVTFNPQSRDKQ